MPLTHQSQFTFVECKSLSGNHLSVLYLGRGLGQEIDVGLERTGAGVQGTIINELQQFVGDMNDGYFWVYALVHGFRGANVCGACRKALGRSMFTWQE